MKGNLGTETNHALLQALVSCVDSPRDVSGVQYWCGICGRSDLAQLIIFFIQQQKAKED